MSKDYSADCGISPLTDQQQRRQPQVGYHNLSDKNHELPSHHESASTSFPPTRLTRSNTATVHLSLWVEHSRTPPLRQFLIVIQIIIQVASSLQVNKVSDDTAFIGIGDGHFADLDGILLHLLKVLTWILALAADRMRSTEQTNAFFVLPLAAVLFASSATSTMEWPPDPTSCLPMFQLLDIVFLFLIFVVTAWSALGCTDLGGFDDMDDDMRDSQGERMSLRSQLRRHQSKIDE
jgi:hypothetical protein